MKNFTFFLIILVSLSAVSCNNNTTEKGNFSTLYFNGDIITMESDSAIYAEAVVEENGMIVFVGTLEEANEKFGNANRVDLNGKTMLPAFLDGHGHFYNVGFTALCANLLPPPDGPGDNYKSIVETMRTYIQSEDGQYVLQKLGWIMGNGYDDSQLEEKNHPNAKTLDGISTEYPVIIIHQSGHLGAINTVALELLGIDSETSNPEGGVIRRDENGNPTGVLEEGALFQVLFPLLGKIDEDMAMKCILKGQEEYAKNGYLTAQDGRTTIEQLASLRMAADSSMYFIDVVAYPDITLGTEHLTQGKYTPSKIYQGKFRIGGVKLTLDGSPQGKTAWITKCYHVNPEGRDGCYTGYPIMDDNTAIGYVETAFKNHWQLLAHTNGDAAIDQYIQAIESAQSNYGYKDHRTVMIHGQTLRKNQIPSLVELNILPSLFPMHTYYWGDWHRESVLGEERAEYISPCKDAINAGLTITSHHDAPVTFPNSMRVLDATVNRVTRSGFVLGPDQRVTPYQGLKTLTDWAAFQYFEENSKGTLTVGKLADFVILDKNPLKIDLLEIHNIQIVESIKEGNTVYSN
ncbi:amidohydrolase [Phaeocystidibacter marisrubri]|uniref:Amidohydrolase n=1 Tax=Phaeocystidibacter marisrubri TaxID=1577780 RepID=A0A6L3ZIU8_9FLAO|nr:amidohydrolase [Phaeocystidibacter marisrubri]KAB2817395.1 amidohydrolase [Phaeocystidibacter marisrubri]